MHQFFATTALLGLCSGLLVGQPAVAAPAPTMAVQAVAPTADRTPAVTALGPTSLAVVWPDAGRKRVSLQTSAAGTWSAPAALDTSGRIDKASGVGVAADVATKRLFVAAVVGGAVQVRVKANGKWSRWTGIGSGYVGVPAVANLGQGNFAVVARTTKKTLQARFFRGGKWARWVRLTGTFSTSPTTAGHTRNTVVIAAADTRGTVRTTTLAYGAKPAAWRATSLRTAVTPGIAVNTTTKAWHLLTRAKDGTVSEQRSTSGGRKWTAAAKIGAGLASGVGVTSRTGGLLDAVGLDPAGRLVRAAFAGRRWSAFQIVEPLVVSASTSVLSDGAIAKVAGEPTGEQKLTVQDPAAVPQPGEVIVASSTTATPDGLLARVVSVDTAADGTATVTTTPAKLTDAMPSGTIDVPFILSAADVQTVGRRLPAREATARAASAEPLTQAIRKNITCSGSVGASVSGSVSISPEFQLTASWSVLRGVQEVTFTGGVTEDARLRAAIDAQASCRLDPTPLLASPIRFRPIVFMAGPVPIVISPQLQLYLDASGDVRAAVAVEVRQTAEATAGLRWKDGTINPIGRLSNTFTYTPPSPTVNVTLEAGVAPKFSFLLYGVAGPRLDTRVYVRLNADPSATPSWTLRAGITAGVHLVVPPLDISHGKSDVIKFEKVLAQAAPRPTTPPVTPPTPSPPAGSKIINATVDGWATCIENDKWSFFLTGAGGTSGVPVPSSISAKIKGGGTLTIPVVRRATSPSDHSNYSIASSAKLTGEATAILDEDWNASNAMFTMAGGPCAPTVTTISASRTTAKTKTNITLSGRIRTSAGGGINQQPFSIRWHSPTRLGKGQIIDLNTNADGTFSKVVTVDDIGKHNFSAEYRGSGPLEAALDASEATVTVTVTR